MDDDKYPHWKDALFGNNDAVANIRCAIHYVFWHTAYMVIGIVGFIAVGALLVAKAASTVLGPFSGPVKRAISSAIGGIKAVVNHRYTVKLADGLLIGATILSTIGLLIIAIYEAIQHPMFALQVAGLFVLGVVSMVTILFLADIFIDSAEKAASAAAQTARSAGEKATKTPGIRRVYGECPVSMNQSPKWFDDLFKKGDEF